MSLEERPCFAHLQVLADLLAVCDSLDLSGGGQVQGLAEVGEAERSGYPHVCQGKVIYIQQRSQPRQTENRMTHRDISLALGCLT